MISAHSRARSRASRCGFDRYTVTAVVWRTISCETLACMSTAIPTGTSGPTSSRTRRDTSPSTSGYSSETAAPWFASSTPSHGPLSLNRSIISPTMRSNASFVMVPIGPVRA